MNIKTMRSAKAFLDGREMERCRSVSGECILEEINRIRPDQIETCSARAFQQYRLLRKHQSFLYKRIYDFASICLLVARKRSGHRETRHCSMPIPNKGKAVYLGSSSNAGIIPNSLQRRYLIVEEQFLEKRLYHPYMLEFWEEETRRFRWSPFFRVQTLTYLANVAYAIWKHSPEAVITTSESSFTTSLITAFCRSLGVRHICVMHGEKLLQPGTAFFEVDTFYVWDNHYAQLFRDCGAKVGEYIVENPWKANRVGAKGNRATYYLQVPPRNMRRFANEMRRLESYGWTVKLRPHPSDLDRRQYLKYFTSEYLEDAGKVNILDSIDSADMVISQYSTVLFQAWSRGVTACIDDVTNHSLFESIEDKRYIMLERDHVRLSAILGGKRCE